MLFQALHDDPIDAVLCDSPSGTDNWRNHVINKAYLRIHGLDMTERCFANGTNFKFTL